MANLAQHIVLYDGGCPLCTFQMKLLTWLDWFDVARLLPIDDPRAGRSSSSTSTTATT